MGPISQHIRHNIWGIVAVFIALGGTAAALPGKNQVDSGDIKKAQVKNSDLANGAVTNPKLAADAVDGSKVADNSLKGTDVDEASLNIPQQALPTTLPPSGPAGGDLSGTYPDPQVQESGLVPGGDLSGTLANAQVSEAGLTAAGDVTGALSSTAIANNALGAQESGVAEDEIVDQGVDSQDVRDESISDDDITDTERQVVIPAGTIGTAAINEAGEPDPGTISGFPAVVFDPTTNETLTLTLQVPDDIGPLVEIVPNFMFASPVSGTVRWEFDRSVLTPNANETLSSIPLGPGNGFQIPVVADHLRLLGAGGSTSGAAAGDLVRIRITRDVADASDDINANDVALLAVIVDFETER